MTDTSPNESAAQPTAPIAANNKARTVWGIILLAGPSALWIIVFILSAINNYVWINAVADAAAGGLYLQDNPAHIAINVLAWVLGIIAFLSWLPGLIIGIILLATKK